MTRALDLSLPEPERRRASALIGRWRDLLYVPGPGFRSSLEPGTYRSSFVIVLAAGQAIRLGSFVVPAFGGELCRIRLEPVTSYRVEMLGSFFEPSRRGLVYAMSGDRLRRAARVPDQPGWSYDGPSLAARLASVERVRRLRERVTGKSNGEGFSWVADRGLVLAGADGQELLMLADASEDVLFMPLPGLYRALLHPAAAVPPGATVRELLGYGDREASLAIEVEIEPI